MKICKYIAPLLVLLAACQREGSPVTPETPVLQLVEHTLYASTPGEDEPATRTVVSALNDKKILWSAQERISILSGGGNYLFQGDNDIPAATASFTGTGPADLGSYIALYPYNLSATYSEGYVSTTLPAYQLGKAGSFGDGYLITADDATGNSLSFKHLCSGLRFMVNRDDITGRYQGRDHPRQQRGKDRRRFPLPLCVGRYARGRSRHGGIRNLEAVVRKHF